MFKLLWLCQWKPRATSWGLYSVCLLENTHSDSGGLRQLATGWKSFSIPEDFIPPYAIDHNDLCLHTLTHTHTHRLRHTKCTHQVFEKRSELLGEDRELEEGWTEIRIVSVHTVFSKLLQGLSVLLLILHMGWKTQTNTHTYTHKG